MTASTASDLLEHSRVANQRPRLQLLRGCITLLARQLKCLASERPLECLLLKCPLACLQSVPYNLNKQGTYILSVMHFLT